MPESDICFMTATEMAHRIRARELSCREVMQAHLTRIDRINPKPLDNIVISPAGMMKKKEAASYDDMATKRRKKHKNKIAGLVISMCYNEQKSKFSLFTNPSYDGK